MKPKFPTPEPQVVWNHFFDLVAVPRPSKDEGLAVDFIEKWANAHGFRSLRDGVNNICVHVPATSGSNKAPLLLQCHLDIVSVTEDRDGVGADASAGEIPMERGDFDPQNEKRLIPNPNGDWINSPYTTLGADNGIGVVMMMALAEEKERPVPLELLFTVDEEAGMTGAFGLDPDALGITSKTLVNIDTEEDTEITIGAAGGRDVEIQLEGQSWAFSQVAGQSVRIKLHGIKGGHSGIEINQGRANANRLLARSLKRILEEVPFGIAGWKGGSRRNAIPDVSEVQLVILGEAAVEIGQIRTILDEVASSFDRLYAGRDNSIKIEVEEVGEAGKSKSVMALDLAGSMRLVNLLIAVPNGICEMTPELPILVESSCNMAIVDISSEGPNRVICSVRGTTAEALDDVTASVKSVVGLAQGSVKISDGYPGWKPDLKSDILAAAKQAYRELFGEDAHVHAVHAGLECGLLAEKIPGLKAISIGPTIKGNHAVGERVSIPSVAKSYQFVQSILKNLSK